MTIAELIKREMDPTSFYGTEVIVPDGRLGKFVGYSNAGRCCVEFEAGTYERGKMKGEERPAYQGWFNQGEVIVHE